MTSRTDKKNPLDQAAEDLFNYAIERDDIKYLLAVLPKDMAPRASKVDYELQLLKIIGVGWTIVYHLHDKAIKDALAEAFWRAINDFSGNLSETTGLMIGQDIDYFSIIKQRLDAYVKVMGDNPDEQQPEQVIGRQFAAFCGQPDDLHLFMAGAKLFASTSLRVQQYLDAVASGGLRQ